MSYLYATLVRRYSCFSLSKQEDVSAYVRGEASDEGSSTIRRCTALSWTSVVGVAWPCLFAGVDDCFGRPSLPSGVSIERSSWTPERCGVDVGARVCIRGTESLISFQFGLRLHLMRLLVRTWSILKASYASPFLVLRSSKLDRILLLFRSSVSPLCIS